MKYLIISHEDRDTVYGPGRTAWGTHIGTDRDVDHGLFPEYNAWRRTNIDNGGFDRYWGPLDSVVPLEINGVPNEQYAVTTYAFNTLEAGSTYFDLRVDPDNNIKNPLVYVVKLVQVQDDGTVVSVVREANSKPLPV